MPATAYSPDDTIICLDPAEVRRVKDFLVLACRRLPDGLTEAEARRQFSRFGRETLEAGMRLACDLREVEKVRRMYADGRPSEWAYCRDVRSYGGRAS